MDNQNTSSPLDALVEEVKKVNEEIMENNNLTQKALDEIEAEVDESIEKIETIHTELDQADEKAETEFDQLILEQSEDLAEEE